MANYGRRLGVFMRRRERAKSEFRRRNIFELCIVVVAPVRRQDVAAGEA